MKDRLKKLLVGNALWNSAGIVVAIIGGFITAPFLIHRLGTNRYSIWVLIGSLDGYLGLLDMGVRGSIGRHIAFHRSKGDMAGLQSIFRSALAIQLCVAAAGILACVAAIVLFFHLFQVPADDVAAARIALIIMACGIVIEFPMCVFDAALWGLNRFGVLNAIDIPAVAARTALTIVMVGRGYGLITLASINVLLTVGTHVAKAIALLVIEPIFRDMRPRFEAKATKELFGWGFWMFVVSLGRTIAEEASTVIVGSAIAISLVTPLSVTARLIMYVSALLVAASDVLTPVATGFHAGGDRHRQAKLLLDGGMHCTALVIVASAGLVFLGKSFLTLWIGSEVGTTSLLLPVLVAGMLLPLSQRAAYSIVLAAGKHRALAISAILENAVAIPAALMTARRFGMIGVCASFASAAILNRLVFQFVFGCILTGVPFGRCFWQTLCRPILMLALPVSGLAMLVALAPPINWIKLVMESMAFVLACLAAWNVTSWIRRGVERVRVAVPSSPALPATVD
jgi:O-antigen/teichoic acid export membrane protein